MIAGRRGGVLAVLVLGGVSAAHALPAPPALQFVAPTPDANALATASPVGVRLEAPCTFTESTLAVSLNGVPIPQAGFLPFGPCSAGRRTSQVATIAVALPNGTITGGPTSLQAGQAGTYTGSAAGGDGLRWNFHGAAPAATGLSAAATFHAAGTFVVRATATKSQGLAASGLDGGNVVTAERAFAAADATPATRTVTVTMPPDIDFRNYEAAHVHPLALSAGATALYAVNTPESRLAIFAVAGDGSLTADGDVPVGLDPVSLAVRPATTEVWVVNHLSDSVSVVDAAQRKVVATLAVGDEPTDVVFASGRAFVTLAGNQDRVRVFDATSRALLASVDLFGDDPRALVASATGTEVYAVVLNSGNRTTLVPEIIVTAAGGPPAPSPARLPALGPAPEVGLIVKWNASLSRWEDETGDNWTPAITYTLPDQDVFVIDADAPTPSVIRTMSGVGTSLLDVMLHPTTGQLWVPNTDARNLVRFQPNLRGHPVETRLTRVNPTSGAVLSHVNLNPHINYAITPGPPAEIALSLAHPGDGVFTAGGGTLYLTAFSSGKVAVLNGTTGTVTARIAVGGGPSGVALNEGDARLYVLNRFENTISTVDTGTNTQIAVLGIAGPAGFDPSPDVIKAGRRFLYDAALTSGHGDVSCDTCHLFGDNDMVAWDLGDPQGTFVPYTATPWVNFDPIPPDTTGFDPMKGPMTTQTLRGLAGTEPFHWRGDRENFQHFNGAFTTLLGRGSELDVAEMDAYTAFIMTVQFPPNPFMNLDNSLPTSVTVPAKSGGGATTTGSPTSGLVTFLTAAVDGPFNCNQCHTLPTGTSGNLIGTAGFESQEFKIPQIRNMYEKAGFAPIRLGLLFGANPANVGLSAQKSGFGFIHDGTTSMIEFLDVFTMTDTQERDMFAFLMSLPTDSVPAIGRQVTVTASNKTAAAVVADVTTLVSQAETLLCDLVVKGVMGGVAMGWTYNSATNLLDPDSLQESPQSATALRTAVAGSDVITFMGVPPGAGVRLGIDRDRDTFLDRTEQVLGTDPADPNSNPWAW